MTASIRPAGVCGVFLTALAGWAIGGPVGAATGVMCGVLLVITRWFGQPLWSWWALYRARRRGVELGDPVTVANDRSGGGVRCQDGIAVVAVQVLGRAHSGTLFTGSAGTSTDNVLDTGTLRAMLQQSLGLTLQSISVVCSGSRRRPSGDYPRVYDTLIGTPPYAGQRETWVIARIAIQPNSSALGPRVSVGTAALAAGQRIAAELRGRGVRARVATGTDIVEWERRLGCSALAPQARGWRSLRTETGWLTTYWTPTAALSAERWDQAWALRVDGIIQNITLYPDGTATATVGVRTAQRPDVPPSTVLRTLSGQQHTALAANLTGPVTRLRGVPREPEPAELRIPVGPSGVLIGKVGRGHRLALPLCDVKNPGRVHVAAEEAVSTRLVIRAAAAGERVTVHTRDPQRWTGVRMAGAVVTEGARPASGTTLSVTDGEVMPAPRPHTVMSIGAAAEPSPGAADVTITQVGPGLVEVRAGVYTGTVEVELFRAENRYLFSTPDPARTP